MAHNPGPGTHCAQHCPCVNKDTNQHTVTGTHNCRQTSHQVLQSCPSLLAGSASCSLPPPGRPVARATWHHFLKFHCWWSAASSLQSKGRSSFKCYFNTPGAKDIEGDLKFKDKTPFNIPRRFSIFSLMIRGQVGFGTKDWTYTLFGPATTPGPLRELHTCACAPAYLTQVQSVGNG